MTNTSGLGSTAAQNAISNVTAGGVQVILTDTEVNKTDTATDIDNVTILSQNVAEADVTINSAADFTGVDTLVNDNDILFDVSAETAVLEDVVIRSQTDNSQWLVADEVNTPDLSQNDEYRINASTTLYELGNPT